MRNNYMQASFNQVCKDAIKAKDIKSDERYVSLYESRPFYGGPEEGGWWGSDVYLVAAKKFENETLAMEARDAVLQLAEDLNKDAKRSFGEQCAREMEWLDARGLDADYLPEPDGETRYFVNVEKKRGKSESKGDRYYS